MHENYCFTKTASIYINIKCIKNVNSFSLVNKKDVICNTHHLYHADLLIVLFLDQST